MVRFAPLFTPIRFPDLFIRLASSSRRVNKNFFIWRIDPGYQLLLLLFHSSNHFSCRRGRIEQISKLDEWQWRRSLNIKPDYTNIAIRLQGKLLKIKIFRDAKKVSVVFFSPFIETSISRLRLTIKNVASTSISKKVQRKTQHKVNQISQ